MNFEDYELRALDHIRQSQSNYWNALLTFNGILISVFSAAAIVRPDNKWFFIGLVLIPIVVAFLLVKNFSGIKGFDIRKAQGLTEDLSDEEKQANIREANAEKVAIDSRDGWIERLLFIEAFLIVVVLLSS